ncbi:hypothetical protein VTK56DRAFT_8843 [Thermocarpiscus australiensis]
MSLPSSPAGGISQPLQPISHNSQRESSLFSTIQHHRERGLALADNADPRGSSVHEKISQFNSLAVQSKQLERKTADAALKRAMLGREEAEAEMRRYREEARMLRKQVEEGKDRERRVGERLEAVMENYGRAKETFAHTQQLWEKEIRRARKETFKAQSALVKLQEELKSCRAAQKAAEEELQCERERSKAREQEAFAAKYSLVGLQEQLNDALERVKMLEQERDALKTLAQNEEDVRRIASEGKQPLPPSETDTEEDASESATPERRPCVSSVKSSTNESDIEMLMLLLQWEKQRADRALEQVQFLETECQLKICPTGKSLRRGSVPRLSSPRRKRGSLLKITDAGDQMILRESPRVSPEPEQPTHRRSKTDLLREKEPRRTTIFLPAEGIFRTVSQAEAEAQATKASTREASPTETASSLPITPTDSDPMFRRTPSVDPPDFAVLSKERTSLLSLLNAPHRQDGPAPVFNIPTTPAPDPMRQDEDEAEPETGAAPDVPPPPPERPSLDRPHGLTIPPPEPVPRLATPLTDPLPTTTQPAAAAAAPYMRPHTTASHYSSVATVTTTTKVPLREETHDGPTLAQRLLKMQRTPSRPRAAAGNGDGDDDGDDLGAVDPDRPSFDVTNPALTPTMTREQALAQIRERRGRARSVGRNGIGIGNGNGNAVTPRKVSGGGGGGNGGEVMQQRGDKDRGRERERERREVSAPTARAVVPPRPVSVRRVRS